ncbi:unnamed protein product [Orchesella dallaii]|uniref:DOMON domain-containing protein n=1 Tax=Orchesella dallaii TaxID=48710 RepID=A0ABP1PT96_9HEXA
MGTSVCAMCILVFLCALLTILCGSGSFASPQNDDNPYRHEVTLDSKGKYKLIWFVDWDEERVIFNVTVTTNGYIGLGLSKRGKMAGADIIIGGVGKDGKPYFTDRHAVGNNLPEIDSSQDWTLHEAWERGTQTFLSFSRPFDTCDADHDFPISDDVLELIWAYGEVDDNLQYHFENRGSYKAYLLDPDLAPREMNRFRSGGDKSTKVFNMTTERTLNEDYIYWCSFHKVPTKTKQHVIGFDVVFPTEQDRRHVHHLVLYRCFAPPGVEAETMFEGLARSGGNECYVTVEPDTVGARYCGEVIYSWAVGGKAIFFPDHVGLPISEQGTEYFMLETHYDNPNQLTNLRVGLTLETYYTNRLREHDAGCLWIGEWSPAATSIIIPPNSLSHVTMGHCAPGCTQRFFKEDVNIFAFLQHTHLAGRGVRALHFRGEKELPWIVYDDNYDFNFQQFRILRKERVVKPGDQILQRCVYETTNTNGSVVEGGFSTRQEMCDALLYYYNKAPGFSFCLSEIKTESYYNFLGIQNVTWDGSRKDMVVTGPPQVAGLTMQEYSDNHIEWDIRMREEIQRRHKYEPHTVSCPNVVDVAYGNVGDDVVDEGGNDDDWENERILRYTGDGKISLVRKHQESTQRRERLEEDSDNDVFSGRDQHMSALPQGITRYRRPEQCTRGPGWSNPDSNDN